MNQPNDMILVASGGGPGIGSKGSKGSNTLKMKSTVSIIYFF